MNTIIINAGASLTLGASAFELLLNIKGKHLNARSIQFLGIAIALLGFVY